MEKNVKKCCLDDRKICDNCGECDRCDLDPKKICNNCGKCLDQINTDEKGFVKIPIDKIIYDEDMLTVEDFFKMAGLDDDDEEENTTENKPENKPENKKDHN